MSSFLRDDSQSDASKNVRNNTANSTAKSAGHRGSILVNGKKYPLPEVVIENIEKVIGLQTNQEKNTPVNERILSQIAAACGRSRFLYYQLGLFGSWWFYSRLVDAGTVDFGWPLFSLQNQGIDAASLLIATGVLVRQAQQDKISEQRSHLMLQVNLLNEQKVAKVIELLEELRTDLPNVRSRYDWEAKEMQKSTDPQVVLDILQENLDHTANKEGGKPTKII
ncbi:MAG: DUF1003 domain-containing protein [Phormidesmis sp.]